MRKSSAQTVPPTWRDGKQQHIELSDTAAEHYDEIYGEADFATAAYMDYEIQIIETVMAWINSKTLALDLGCGTGRDSAVLAKQFAKVCGYDFSEKMIAVANAKKKSKGWGNVGFSVLDIENTNLPHNAASVDLVNTAFGMGSFLENPDTLLAEIHRVLAPLGYGIFSFYNSASYSGTLPLPWTPALAATVVPGENMLNVNFGNRVFEIGARAYSLKEVECMLSRYFRVVQITTYPSLSALMPQDFFSTEAARKLCMEVDQYLAANINFAAGPYIVAVCRKTRKTIGLQ